MLRRIAFATLALAVSAPCWAVMPVPIFAQRTIVGGGFIGWLGTTVQPLTTCVGGEPTGSWPPCSAETTQISSRGEMQIWEVTGLSDAVAPYLSGPISFTVHCDMAPDYRGPCWGTFSWDVQGVGSWVGHWTAPLMDLVTYESKIEMTAYGVGGNIDGMKLSFKGSSAPGDWYIAFTARLTR